MSLEFEYLAADLFGLAPFSRQVLSGNAPFLGVEVPRNARSLHQVKDRFDHDERAALTAKLTESLARYSPHVAVLDSIRALEQPQGSIALATARVGVFGSTLDALYSALHAIKISQEHARVSDHAVVPLLWIDTDNDASRVAFEAHFKSSDFHHQRVELPANYNETETDAVRACLRQLLGQDACIDEALDLLSPQANESLSATMTRGLLEMLGSFGLLVCSPDDYRDDVSHHLSQVVAGDPESDLRTSLNLLKEHGFADTDHSIDSVLVHRLANDQKLELHSGGDGFRYDDEPGSRTAAELAAEIVQAPREFVPGAALLPIIQELTLPVAIRVVERQALFSEAALERLRSSIGVPGIPVVPRFSCTLVDRQTRDSLARLNLTTREVCGARKTFLGPDPTDELREAIEAFHALSKDSTEALQRIARPLWGFDPVLRPVARRSARDIRRTITNLCERAENVLNARSGQFHRHQRRVHSVIVPQGSPQETVESLLTWVAPGGPAWIQELLSKLEPFAWEHVVVNFP